MFSSVTPAKRLLQIYYLITASRYETLQQPAYITSYESVPTLDGSRAPGAPSCPPVAIFTDVVDFEYLWGVWEFLLLHVMTSSQHFHNIGFYFIVLIYQLSFLLQKLKNKLPFSFFAVSAWRSAAVSALLHKEAVQDKFNLHSAVRNCT